ncbi:MAG: Trp biosynthesis-associated membrane protein [Rhodoluna sp.]
MTKGRVLTLWVGFVVMAYIFASQDWYALSMAPDGETVKLSSYDGLTAYANLSPLLMLNFAAILVVAFVSSLARKIVFSLVGLANLASLVWLTSRVISQDVSGLAKQVEQMTGIAAAHGVKGLTVATQAAANWALISLLLMTAVIVFALLTERRWPKRVQKTETPNRKAKESEPKDAIGIWDSQRR